MKLAINLGPIWSILKKYLGEIFILLGTALTVYNLSGFVHQSSRFYTPPKPPTVNTLYWAGNYYFSDEQRTMITLGVVLIIAGVMVRKSRRKSSGELLN